MHCFAMSPKAISACKRLWNWSEDTRGFILDEQNLCLALLADDWAEYEVILLNIQPLSLSKDLELSTKWQWSRPTLNVFFVKDSRNLPIMLDKRTLFIHFWMQQTGDLFYFRYTRSYAALRAADLDWIIGPGYSSGIFWGKTMKNQPGTMKNQE